MNCQVILLLFWYAFPQKMPPSSISHPSYFSSITCINFTLQGLHPRIIAEGFEAAKDKALASLEELKVTREMDRETLINVARTSLRTKVHAELADLLTEVCIAAKCHDPGRHTVLILWVISL